MIQDNRDKHEEIARRLADTAGVQNALKQAALEAIRDHAQSGHKVVVWRNNQIIWEVPNPSLQSKIESFPLPPEP